MKCKKCENLAKGGPGKYFYLCDDCRIKTVGKIISEKNKVKREKDPDALKKQSPRCIEYWLCKGLTKEEAEIELQKIFSDHSKKLKKSWEAGKFENREIPTQIKYWISRGFDRKQAIQKVSERQKTFSLEKCIEKNGKDIGTQIWKERQIRWQKTLKALSNYDEIQKSKGLSLKSCIKKYGEVAGNEYYQKVLKSRTSGYSKISQKLFHRITEKMLETDKIYFYEKNHEFYKSRGSNCYLYDFVISNLKFCIEFHGDIWHGNPSIYSEENYVHPFDNNISLKDIHNKDKIKQDLLEDLGFEYLVIWESDFKRSEEETIEYCIRIINECRKKVHKCS